MEKFEHTEHGKPEMPSPEESGIRRISKPTSKEEEKEMFRKMAAKAEEVHPDDPWEEVAPITETDTAKVWGENEDLDKEDLEHFKKLAKRLTDEQEATKHLPEDEFDKVAREAVEQEIKKRSA